MTTKQLRDRVRELREEWMKLETESVADFNSWGYTPTNLQPRVDFLTWRSKTIGSYLVALMEAIEECNDESN